MITINAVLKGHQLKLAGNPVLASGSVEADQVHFQFDEPWQGLRKIALFWRWREETAYATLVNSAGNALIPAEVLDEKRKMRFGVYGVEHGETTPRITSTLVTVQVPDGAWSADIENPGEITPTIVEQFIADIDAAIEGALLNYGVLPTGSDLDSVKTYSLYGLSSQATYGHCPVTSGTLYTMRYGLDSDALDIWMQIIYAFDGGIYKRYYINGWTDWALGTRNNYGVLPTGSNLNSVKETCIWGISSQLSYVNCPINSGLLFTTRYGLESDGIDFWMQMLYAFDGGVYKRYHTSAWSPWVQVDGLRALNVYNHLGVSMPSVTDLDDIRETGMWGISSQFSYDNCPLPSSGWLECYRFQAGPDIYVQRVWSLADDISYTRYYINGRWSAWISRDGRDLNNVYYAFGDSTTYGQVGGVGTQSPYNYPACVGRLLKMTVKNKGVGGQGLIKDWNTIHTNYINGLDMSDAALISVGWAYNDGAYYSGMNFGAYDDTGSTTFIGKYFTIMKEFQQKCPTARIVLITGYGWPDGTVSPMTKPTLTEQFTHKYAFADGQKSIREMYDTLEEMCYLHGWGCINQAKGTPFNQWNVDEMIGDQIHPTNAGYIAYGNMIAARMSAIWGNLYKW